MKTLAFILALTSFTCVGAFGWDNPGHMSVAGLAYDELTDAERTKLTALLRQHSGANLVTEGFPAGAIADRDFVMAMATWPDLIKGSAVYADNGYEENEPAVTVIEDDHKKHKGWHFIDTPFWVGSGPAQQLPAIPPVNAVGVVNILMVQLQTHQSDAAKAYELGWLMHLVGDLHQPLHAVTAVSETLPKGDRGGNLVTLDGETHGAPNLHAYWDDVLGKSAPRDPESHKARLDQDVVTAGGIVTGVQTVALGQNADNLDPSVWTEESFKMAKEDVYHFELRKPTDPHDSKLHATVDAAYRQTAETDAKIRIRLAGHRLALLLKKVLN